MSETPRTPPNAPRPKEGAPSGTSGKGGRSGGAANPAAKDPTAPSDPAPSAAELASSPGEAAPVTGVSGAQTAGTHATAGAAAGAGNGQRETSGPAAGSAASPAGAPAGPMPSNATPRPDPSPVAATPAAPPTPAGLNAPTKRFEPAILPIAAAVVVLGGAVAYLVSSPRERQPAPGAVIQADAARRASVDSRLAALEARPNAAGLAERAANAERRLDAAEAAARELAARPVVDPEARSSVAGLNAALEAARSASAEGLRRLEERAAALDARLAEESRRAEARIAQAEATLANRLTGAEQALAARVTAAEQAFAPRLAALDAALNQRVEAAGQGLTQRIDAATRSLDERLSRAEAQGNERAQRQEQQLAERVRQFEQRLAQAEAAERRLGALAARGAIQTALESGRPLGQALSGLSGTPPVALIRYAQAAPPTESALRLSFEDAARAARLAAEPQGQSVTDTALSRLQGLVTVRRGDQVVVGDAVSGELERARRSLDAGDLAGAVERLEKLPEPSRNAMAGWIGQARDLVEARAAVRDLGSNASGAGAN
ncbi:mitofilin family membrane protein [Roseomonas sp. GCM10028921]